METNRKSGKYRRMIDHNLWQLEYESVEDINNTVIKVVDKYKSRRDMKTENTAQLMVKRREIGNTNA